MPPSTNLLIRASMALSVQACAPVKCVHMYMYVCVCASVGFCVYLPIIINCTLMSPKQDSGTSAGPRYSFSTRPRCQQSACIIMIDLFLTLPVVKPGYRIIPSCWTAAHCTVKTLEHNTHTYIYSQMKNHKLCISTGIFFLSLCFAPFTASLFPPLSPFFIQICSFLRQTVGRKPFARPSKGTRSARGKAGRQRVGRRGGGKVERSKEAW